VYNSLIEKSSLCKVLQLLSPSTQEFVDPPIGHWVSVQAFDVLVDVIELVDPLLE